METLSVIQLDPLKLSWMVAAFVGLSIFFLMLGLRSRRLGVETLDDRVKRYAQLRTAEEIELAEPFSARVVMPTLQNMLRIVGRFAPQRNIEDLERNLAQAGRPLGLTAIDFLGARLLAAISLGLAVGGIAFLANSSVRLVLLCILAGGLVGFYAPMVLLRWRVAGRQKMIQRALPDALDLLVVCVDAGLGLDAAILKVAHRWRHELAREFDQVAYEVSLGRPRLEALQNLVTRTGVEDVATFVAVIAQADQLGVSIGKALRIHSEQMRVLRRYRAEEQARQAALKMLFPLVFLIFPALFAVILGPAIPHLLRTLAHLG
jgi:tight adherence protein C